MKVGNYDIKPVSRDPDEMDRIEEKMRTVPNFLPRDRTFLSVATQPGATFFEVGDSGVIGAVDVRQGFYAEAHVTFWDKNLEDKIEICREVASFIMEACRLHFLLTFVPENHKKVIEFAAAVGFVPLEVSSGVMTMVLVREKPKWD